MHHTWHLGHPAFYMRQVDPTMFVAIRTIAAAQSHETEATTQAISYLLDYCATYLDATICYNASNMILKGHCDALYLSE
eukprot:5155845-Ditylum_brightwellii.AAC.1